MTVLEICDDGFMYWNSYTRMQYHNKYGPAIISTDGSKIYIVCGELYSYLEYVIAFGK